ncbi:MAG: cytochrome P450 [Chloroflexi bacterium]|nr:cytochrome P450 [Chloroflexota bacterium]
MRHLTVDTNLGQLSLPEELILLLLNEESGYFRQVPGWNLNCAVVGAALAELSLLGRIDTDLTSLIVLDRTETGDPALDPLLIEIADDPSVHNAQFWVERLAAQAESIIDLTLARLVELEILQHHDGDYWSLGRRAWRSEGHVSPDGDTAAQFVKSRIARVILDEEIPEPRDVIIISLANTCDVLRLVFQLDELSERRIELICKMDLIGRSISQAVAETLVAPLVRRGGLARTIPSVPLHKLLLNRQLRSGNLAAIIAGLAEEYGPVFQIRIPSREPMTCLAGPEVNRWAHRYGRMYLTAGDYLRDFEEVYGAHGILPALDGAHHYRFRKAMSPAYSRKRLEGQLDTLFHQARSFMDGWTVGDRLPLAEMCRQLTYTELSPIAAGVESQDIIGDLIAYKERALATHVVKVLPKWLLRTPSMRRKAGAIDELVNRVQRTHTRTQRVGRPRDMVDDLLSLHSNDPQLLPETNLRFFLSAPLLVGIYLADALAFAVHAMVTQPEIYGRIQNEADAMFDHGEPTAADFTDDMPDVTNRFIKEVLRVYPVVPVSMRKVSNTAVVEGYELPVGTHVYIAQSASHYMNDVFPEPERFDIDRYLPDRQEDLSPGYAPYGLGTHTCLGSRWAELQIAVNLLMLTHHFRLSTDPAGPRLQINPFPSLSPGKKLKLVIAEQRNEIRLGDAPDSLAPAVGCPVLH